MEYKDYYKTLGVARDAPQADIKRAFRKLARKYHPDVSKESNAEARFKEVNEANEVLQDPEKRAAYDALGSSWQPGQDFRPPPGGGRSQREYRFSTDETADFSDLAHEGSFRVACRTSAGELSSYPFLVQKDVLERHTLSNVLFYFKGQRSSGRMD